MPGTTNVRGGLKIIGMPEEACFKSFAEFLEALQTYSVLEIPTSITNVTVSKQQPSSSERNNVWFRFNDSGEFVGIYIFTNGAWTQTYPTSNISNLGSVFSTHVSGAMESMLRFAASFPAPIVMPRAGKLFTLVLTTGANIATGTITAKLFLNGVDTGFGVSATSGFNAIESVSIPIEFNAGDYFLLQTEGTTTPDPNYVVVDLYGILV